MTTDKNHEEHWYHIWKTVVVGAMALVLLLSHAVAISVPASSSGTNASSFVLVNTFDHDGGAQTEREDLGLTQHSHCTYHSAVRLEGGISVIPRVAPNVLLAVMAEVARMHAPSSLPFKPPRSTC